MLVERFFLIVAGGFDRSPVIYDNYPSQEEIIKVMKDQGGDSARVEKRFVLKEPTKTY